MSLPLNSQTFPITTRNRLWFKRLLLAWLCLKFAGCYLAIPSHWGPRVGGQLPNSHTVYFQARKVGRETDDRLTWIKPNGETHQFRVDQAHAGFGYVEIRYSDGGNRVWVESANKIGASIDLTNGDFRPERYPQHEWAQLSAGAKLSAGRTRSIYWLIEPW